MPEPLTVAALAAIIAENAAAEIGKRLGGALSDKLFGVESDLGEIQEELRRMSMKLDEILIYSKATFILVERLPLVIEEAEDRNTLYLAHVSLDSTYRAFLVLKDWKDATNFNSSDELLKDWTIIIDKEARFEMLPKLPYYGDFLISYTKGAFRQYVLAGVKKKVSDLDNLIQEVTRSRVLPLLQSIDKVLHSPQIAQGSLLPDYPWATWRLSEPRSSTEIECWEHDSNGPGGRGRDHCRKVVVQDTVWNSSLAGANAELLELSKRFELERKVLQAAVIARQILGAYLSKLEQADQ